MIRGLLLLAFTLVSVGVSAQDASGEFDPIEMASERANKATEKISEDFSDTINDKLGETSLQGVCGQDFSLGLDIQMPDLSCEKFIPEIGGWREDLSYEIEKPDGLNKLENANTTPEGFQ